MRQLPGATEWQYAVAIADDARLAAAGGWDGLVRLWNAETGRLLAILVQPRSKGTDPTLSSLTKDKGQRTKDQAEWFAVCPEGYVAGSAGLIGAAKWRAGGVSLNMAPAKASSVCPDKVARAMRGEPVKALSFPTHPSE